MFEGHFLSFFFFFEGHFPISLRLYKYEKNNYDLKIHQDAPHVLAISLCALLMCA